MFFTPKTKRQNTQTTDFSTNLSRVSKRNTAELKRSIESQKSLKSENLNTESDKVWPVAKLQINVKKKKITEQKIKQESPIFKVSPFKYKTPTCSKMSTQAHGNVVAYGVTTFQGHRNIVNPHFSSINLGQINYITFSESFDGNNASKLIKQQFRSQMASNLNNLKQNTYQIVSQTIREIFKKVQYHVVEKQYIAQENSGSTLLSVIFHNQYLIVANAGSSIVICFTKNGSLLKLSDSHTTRNQKQRKRVIKNGGKIYQTVVNVPFHDQLQIQGPPRVSPSGLVFTRCLGKGLDYRRQVYNLSSSEYENPEDHLDITWKPQIKYLNTEDVEWVGIFNEQIFNNCSLEFIKDCVESEKRKKCEKYSEHHIAQEASRKIIQKLISQGVANAMTCIIVILKWLPPFEKSVHGQQLKIISKKMETRKQTKVSLESRKQANVSLSYVGDRKSFIKQISVSSSRNNSLSKDSSGKMIKKRQMVKQFSFNRLH